MIISDIRVKRAYLKISQNWLFLNIRFIRLQVSKKYMLR